MKNYEESEGFSINNEIHSSIEHWNILKYILKKNKRFYTNVKWSDIELQNQIIGPFAKKAVLTKAVFLLLLNRPKSSTTYLLTKFSHESYILIFLI